jgi:hypothetical protein
MSEREQLLVPAEQSKSTSDNSDAVHERLFTLGYPSANDAAGAKPFLAHEPLPHGESGSPELNRLLEAATQAKGHDLWKDELAADMGAVGGAIAVRKVLQQGGLDVQDSAKSVRELTDSLINKSGWTKDEDLNHMHAGDLLVTQQDSHGWVSLVGDHSFYGNSVNGTWQEFQNPRPHPGETFLLHQPEKQ